jgi:hypothetical protein
MKGLDGESRKSWTAAAEPLVFRLDRRTGVTGRETVAAGLGDPGAGAAGGITGFRCDGGGEASCSDDILLVVDWGLKRW